MATEQQLMDLLTGFMQNPEAFVTVAPNGVRIVDKQVRPSLVTALNTFTTFEATGEAGSYVMGRLLPRIPSLPSWPQIPGPQALSGIETNWLLSRAGQGYVLLSSSGISDGQVLLGKDPALLQVTASDPKMMIVGGNEVTINQVLSLPPLQQQPPSVPGPSQPSTPQSPSNLPSWLLPVGIGLAGLGLYMYLK